ncbi:type II toxin-antitoxin system VapC family toxin [Candidatus Kaiserbacteria bacterium]|nr:type II toxin-antitoxin system VapC family toxin [Candidatus Kaiserbacteria bacterium]
MAISSTSVILDSSVWIAFLYREDSQHEKAKKVLQASRKDEIVIPEYVLIEVASTLKRKRYEREAKKFVAEAVVGEEHAFLHAATLAHETADLFCARNDKLSFVDTALLVLSRQYRVITFDAALRRALR